MRFKPIKSDGDYRRTLAQIESLMAALPGTPDGDRLDVLATLAEAWEQKHHPIAPPIRSRPFDSRWSSEAFRVVTLSPSSEAGRGSPKYSTTSGV